MRFAAAALACAGCNAILGLDPTSEGDGADAAVGPWSTPVTLDISTPTDQEDDPTIWGDELYFNLLRADGTGRRRSRSSRSTRRRSRARRG